MIRSNTLALIATLILVCVLTACAGRSPPVSLYTLSATDAVPAGSQLPPEQQMAVGVGPANLARELDRSQVVTRSSSNQVKVDEFHRWGGDLEKDLLRALGENLAGLLDTNRIAIYPIDASFPLDYRVALDIQQFDGQLGGTVTLRARWSVVAPGSARTLVIEQSAIEQATSGSTYHDLVEAESRALSTLSHEIAAQLKALHEESQENSP